MEEGNDVSSDRERRRAIRRKKGEISDSLGPAPGEQPYKPAQRFDYATDLGKFGDPNYVYEPGDEMTHPGPKPPEDDPEFPAWKRHAAAWRRHIGQRQSYVDMMVGNGYDPSELGIMPIKEQGLAGYNRLHQDGYIDKLRSGNQDRFAAVMREGGPSNGIIQNSFGIYEDPRPDGSTNYYDSYGAKTDREGHRIGGSYFYDGKGTQVVNRTSPFGEETRGHATNNGIAPNPTFNPIGTRTFGNPGGATTTPQNPQTGGGFQAGPQTGGGLYGGNSFAPGEPAPGSDPVRSFLKQDTGAGYGSWGSFYGAQRPSSGQRVSARRYI